GQPSRASRARIRPLSEARPSRSPARSPRHLIELRQLVEHRGERDRRLFETVPGIRLQRRDAPARRSDVVCARVLQPTQFLPPEGQRYRRALAGARRVVDDRGRAPAVTQVVDEELPLPLRLRHVRGQPLKVGRSQCFGDGFGEPLHRVPIGLGYQGYDHVQTLASGHAQVRPEPQFGQQVPQATGDLHAEVEVHTGAGVEVEDDDVRLLEVVDGAAPGVDLEHAELDEADQMWNRLQVDVVL